MPNAPAMPTPAPTKRALLIGIDEYDLATGGIKPLQGCCNDVELLKSILVDQYAFDPNDVEVLTNAQATRVK